MNLVMHPLPSLDLGLSSEKINKRKGEREIGLLAQINVLRLKKGMDSFFLYFLLVEYAPLS